MYGAKIPDENKRELATQLSYKLDSYIVSYMIVTILHTLSSERT